MRYPAVFAADAVDRIIASVALDSGTALTDLERQQLSHDLDRAIFWYLRFHDIGPSEPWVARWNRGTEIEKKVRDLLRLLAKDDDEGRFWSQLHGEIQATQGVLQRFEELIDRALRERFSGSNGVASGSSPLGDALEAESSLEWLIGQHLPQLFERWFGRRASVTRPRSQRATGSVYGEPKGVYLNFVQAVLAEGGIKPAKAATVLRYLTRAHSSQNAKSRKSKSKSTGV